MKHLALVLLCIGCGGESFSNDPFSVEAIDGGRTVAGSGGASFGSGGAAQGGVGGRPSAGSGGREITAGGSAGSGGFISLDAGAPAAGAGGSGEHDAGDEGGRGGDGGGAGGVGGAPSGGAGGGDACTTGETRCTGSQPEICADGDWFKSGSACSGSTPVCLDGRCVQCEPGAGQCMSPTQPGICDSTGSWVPSGDACAYDTPQCLDNECVACDPDNVQTASYCPSCGGGIPCCMSTFGDGCGCFTFDGCQP